MQARIEFRPLERRDLDTLAVWLAEPGTARFWAEDADPAAVAARYGPTIDGDDPTEVFVASVDGVDVGIVQRYRTNDHPDWRATLDAAVPELLDVPTAGIDGLIGPPELRHQGLGPAAITRFCAALFEDLSDVVRIVVTVQQANRPSWRALERAGFRRVWAGQLVSDDPADAGPAYLLVLDRPASVDPPCGGSAL